MEEKYSFAAPHEAQTRRRLAFGGGKGDSSRMTEHVTGPGGVRIAYDVVGEGTPIVLVHGFGASRVVTWRNTQWYDWLRRAGRQVIALDCRGHGESDKPHETAS